MSRIGQMSKKLLNLQQQKSIIIFHSNLHSIHKEKHNFEDFFRGIFFLKLLYQIKSNIIYSAHLKRRA